MSASLQQLGKSRADLWQFAGLVALERSLERANRACDLDYWGRQQVRRGKVYTVLTIIKISLGHIAGRKRGL